MPTLHNDTSTDIAIGGVACPAGEAVPLTEAQAKAIAPSLHGVEGFRVSYEKVKPAPKPTRRKSRAQPSPEPEPDLIPADAGDTLPSDEEISE